MEACTGGSFDHGIDTIEEPTRNPPLVARATGAPTRNRPRALSVVMASGGGIQMASRVYDSLWHEGTFGFGS
jgi:hypothetical protein